MCTYSKIFMILFGYVYVQVHEHVHVVELQVLPFFPRHNPASSKSSLRNTFTRTTAPKEARQNLPVARKRRLG